MDKDGHYIYEKNQNRFFLIGISLCTIWTVIIGIFGFFAIQHQKKISLKLAAVAAAASYNKDLVYRRWAALHGGIYVPVSKTTPPNPYLSNIGERDIFTPSGRALTLLNPSYMTRQVHELSEKQYGISGHITSLNPIRTENAPDPWETKALEAFERGYKEFQSASFINHKEYLRFMRPIITEKTCLKCHAEQGYKEGEIRGGISVSVPLAPYKAIESNNIHTICLVYSIILTLGLIILVATFYRFNKQYHRQKDIEEKLKFQAKLLDTVEQSVIATDLNGKILYWNPYSEKMYGWRQPEVLGLDLMDIIIPETNKKQANDKHNKIKKGNSWSGEVHVQHRSGISFPALLTASPIYNDEGRLTGGISISIDLTEKKILESQLQQTQKMEGIGTLAGGIAHDFNNILAPIILHSQMAIEDLEPGNPLRANIKEIYKAGCRARDLVKQILTFARKGSDNKIILRASMVVNEATKFLRSTIPSTIDIRYNNNTTQDTIFANPTHINQIVMNLCTNASHSMQDSGGVIEVTLDNEDIKNKGNNILTELKSGKYLRLTVRDTGTGISPDIIDKIFDPYFTTKEPGKGTGLGLATLHGIVKKYEGDITVKSEPGKGTTFQVYLPLVENKIIVRKKEITAIPKGSEHILFVDDEKAAVIAMQKILERLGYKVTATTNSIEALKLFKNNPDLFDILITDMTMPDITGKDLTLELRKIRPDIPIILYTGFSDSINEKEAEIIGINKFMIKPINKSDIANAIREVLD